MHQKENMHQKLVPDTFLSLVNNPKQPLHAINFFKSKIFWKKIKKDFKNLTLVFLSNPVPFNGQNYHKQKGPWTNDQLFFRLWYKFRKIPTLVMYYLTKFDDVIYSDSGVIPKINNCKFMQVNSWPHKLFHFHLSFLIWKVWKGTEKLQKFEYLKNEKSFFNEIKIFIVFEGLSFDEKMITW